MERKQIFSIKKLKVGAASVLIGFGIVFLANSGEALAADTNNVTATDKENKEDNTTPTAETTTAETSATGVENKQSDAGNNTSSSTLAQGAAAAVNASLNATNTTAESETTKPKAASVTDATTTPNYSGISLTGNFVGGKTEYTVGDQIISTFKLDVSAPSELKEGSYMLITLPENEPIIDVQIGTALGYEKINDSTYKVKLGAISGGTYATINVSYKFDKWRTGRNSNTTVTAQVFDGDKLIGNANTTANVTNTNKTGYAYVSMDTNNGSEKQTLFETSIDGTIDASKNKDLELKLTTTNKELAAVNKIEHEVTLPENVKVAKTSLDAGWTQEGNLAKFIRTITDAQGVFKDGNNTTTDSLFLDVSNAGTTEEFLNGKNFTFSDTATYTDKSGETNSNTVSLDVVVNALNPFKENSSAEPDLPVAGVNPLVINNFTRENTNETTVNTALPNVTADTDDRRIITVWRAGATPTKLKEVEIDVDSDFNQKRSVEFYGIWARGGNAYAPWYAPDDLKTSNILNVYDITDGTEKELGKIVFQKNGATTLDLPDSTKKIILRPEGEMEFTNPELTQIGIYLNQNLKGLDEAKKLIAEGKTPTSVVTAKVATVDYGKIFESTSKTTLVDARTALKLVGRTKNIDTVLAGNTTQGFASGVEVYNYSPAGLGNRVYNTWTSHGYDTSVAINSIAKNPKIIVELPEGFTYAGIRDRTANGALIQRDSVSVDNNYNNTGKRVAIISTNSDYFNTRDDVRDGNYWNNKYLDLAFNVADWVPTGTYQVKYTLVWDENKALLGLNPNSDYEGSTDITNTSTFTYQIPVSNTFQTYLVTEVKDNKTDYTRKLEDVEPGDEITYKLSLENRDNSAVSNNQLIITLPKENDTNIVDTTVSRGSQFPIQLTGAATAPTGWTAVYYTGNEGSAAELEKATWLNANDVKKWSQVTAVKFFSNEGTVLRPGLSNEFSLSAKVSDDAKHRQKAFISAAVKVNSNENNSVFNEGRPAEVDVIEKGTVRVAYVDKQGKIIKETVTAISRQTYDNSYNVATEAFRPKKLKGNDGKEYYYTGIWKSSITPIGNFRAGGAISPAGTIENRDITITYIYDLAEKEVTRTVKYVKEGTTEEIKDATVQKVKLTKEDSSSPWTTETWEVVDVPTTIGGYEIVTPTTVGKVTVNENTKDVEIVIPYKETTEEVPETKTVTRTINYLDATTKEKVSDPVTQTATITRTNVKNKVTGTVTNGEWSKANWAEQASPTVANYNAPDKAKVDEVAITENTTDATETVLYTQGTESIPESKTVTRTINYLDATTREKVSDPVTQTATIKRTNTRNKVTNVVTNGTWSEANWAEQASPTVANYNAPDKAKVDEVAITENTTDATETVLYTQGTESIPESKTVTRTINYLDATTREKVSDPVTQTATITRTNVKNKVTGKVTNGEWSKANWAEQTSPTVANYNAPDKAKVDEVAITENTTDATETVLYTQGTESIPETKTVTRTINYLDATTKEKVSDPVTQTATIKRTNTRNKVTNVVTNGTWSEANWAEQASPSVANYNAPDIEKVDAVAITPTTENANVVVKYTQGTESIPESKTITRTVSYIDIATRDDIRPMVEQKVTLSRTNIRNKVTGKVTEGTWSTDTWAAVDVPKIIDNKYELALTGTRNTGVVNVTSETEDVDIVIPYTQGEESTPESKTVTRTIKYVDAKDGHEVAKTVTQPVTLTRTKTTNKVTGNVTYSDWITGEQEAVTSPSVENYLAPSIAEVEKAEVSANSTDTTITVTYSQAEESIPETRTVTRTIRYIDATTKQEIATKVVQTATITRTNVRNKVTNVVTEGSWSTANWDKVDSPILENYSEPSIKTVNAVDILPTTENSDIVVEYKQVIEEAPETRTVTRTIKYVDAKDGHEVATKVVQSVTITRTKTTNKVTGEVTYSDWTKVSWDEVVSPTIEGYNAPDIAKVDLETVTADTTDKEVVVKYTKTPTTEVPKTEIPKEKTPKTKEEKPGLETKVVKTSAKVVDKKELPKTEAQTTNNMAAYGIFGLLGATLLRRKNKKTK